jgi:Leucine-rich repeat (LRR) protein
MDAAAEARRAEPAVAAPFRDPAAAAAPFPCGLCANFHGNESGFCPQCSRRLVPPSAIATLARAQRKVYLGLLTLVMSVFETSDKLVIGVFALSTTLVVLFWFLTKAVATGDPAWIAALVVVAVAAICCGPVMSRMIRAIEAVDAVADEFDAASKKLLADRDEARRGPASFAPAAAPRQPSRELREIYVRARERRDPFADILAVVSRTGKRATEAPREIRGPSVKHLARAREKTELDYGGDLSQLRDVLRGSVVCETVDELNEVVDALRALEDVEIVRIKNRFRDDPTPSGYRDVNVNLVYHGLVVELQIHLAEVLRVADRQHVAYEAARELDLMGVLEKPDFASLSETAAPAATTVAYNVARLVIALLSLFVAVLYLDVFTLKGLRLFVRRAEPATWRGFEQPYVVHRVYGIALAAPYLANVYMLMRAAGFFGDAARAARRERTRIGLLYERYFGYEGSHFVWKVFCFQTAEVALQAAGKIPLFGIYLGKEGGNLAFWFVYVFVLALTVNVLYPPLLLRSRLVLRQRDVAYCADTFLDIVYALTPFVFLLSGIRSQAMLIPHEPIAYVSNLVPLMHAHFVIATLETAGERARAPKPVAPSDVDVLKDGAEPSPKPAPQATPAGRRYRRLVVCCLGVWTLAMGCFYSDKSPLHWFVRGAVRKDFTCQYEEDGDVRRWKEWGPEQPNTRNVTWPTFVRPDMQRSCEVDADCMAEPGCDGGYCLIEEKGQPVCGTLGSDARCVNASNGFDLGNGDWCRYGYRQVNCFPHFTDEFPQPCTTWQDCADVPGCDGADNIACVFGICETGTHDARCQNETGPAGWFWDNVTYPPWTWSWVSKYRYNAINNWGLLDENKAGWKDEFCYGGSANRICVAPPDSGISAADFVNFGHTRELIERSDVEEGEVVQCAYSDWLWLKFTRGRPWSTRLGFFIAYFSLCLPFMLSFLVLPTFAERAGRRSVSVWRQTLGLAAICFVMYAFFDLTGIPILLTSFLVVLGYYLAIAIEARRVVGLYVSIVALLVVNYYVAFGFVVVGLSVLAFAPQRGEKDAVREKVRRGAQTKADAAAAQGRLPRWACLVYFILTLTFIALAFSGDLGTDTSRTNCFPCECSNHELIDCYGDATTLVWTASSWNRIDSLPDVLKLPNSGIKGIKPGTFESMDWLERLDLSRNKITGIEASTFRGLGQLRELDLDASAIYEVAPFAFFGLRNLEDLRMGNNAISILRSSTFAGLGRLQALDLSYNRIESIEPGAFVGLGALKSLQIQTATTRIGDLTWTVAQSDRNALAVLRNGTFEGLNAVSGSLELGNNGIQIIEPGAFVGLRSLTTLRLHMNDLTALQTNTFLGLENLKELELQGNERLTIETIETGAFAGLDSLDHVMFLESGGTICGTLHATGELPQSVNCW